MPEQEISPENIQSASVIYFASQLEQMKVFDVSARIVDRFVHGLLPVGAGSAGRVLDRYYWSHGERMTQAQRRILYSRILGEPGGDLPPEVQPNRDFADLFLRFIDALAGFTRSRGSEAGLAGAMEAVRAAGCALAGNLSPRGAGYAYYASRRLASEIGSAFSILKQPAIQRAYGAANPYQVIDRVAADELGGAVNASRRRVLAESGKNLLDLLARNAPRFCGASGRPLFSDGGPGAGRKPADISNSDRDALIGAAEQWLAARGTPDDPGGPSQPA